MVAFILAVILLSTLILSQLLIWDLIEIVLNSGRNKFNWDEHHLDISF